MCEQETEFSQLEEGSEPHNNTMNNDSHAEAKVVNPIGDEKQSMNMT